MSKLLKIDNNTGVNFIVSQLGEVRMGCDGFGLIIENRNNMINLFEKEIIFLGKNSEEIRKSIFKDTKGCHYIINGDFFTYIFKPETEELSVYKATIRDDDGIWCEENPILANQTHHISTENKHYYIQFPFVHYKKFFDTWHSYEAERIKQIKSMKSSLISQLN